MEKSEKNKISSKIIALILTEKENEISLRYNYDIYYFKRMRSSRGTETDIADRFATPTT